MLRVRFARAAKAGVPVVRPVAAGAASPDAALAAAARFIGAAGQSAPAPSGGFALRGLGEPTTLNLEAAGGLATTAFPEAPHFAIDARGLGPAAAASLAAGACLRAWRFDALRTVKPAKPLPRLTVLTEAPDAAEQAWDRVSAGVRGTLFARDLVVEPGNRLTPRDFARRLAALGEHDIAVEIRGAKRLRKAGCGALLAVGQAARHGPRLVILRWRGTLNTPPVVFVGKGITFDTGGISIKPAQGMEEMRADMAGAAACAGAILALALRRSPAPAAAVLAIAENAIGGKAYRPGDVLRTRSGRTVEVVDTDAEGRLVLADALDHARCVLRPAAMLDLATLTGSIVTALGHHRAGLFGNDAPLLGAVAAAGEAVGEPLWPMPIGERHRADLASDIADLRHCLPAGSGQGWGGRFMPDACHAAAFLREFVGDTPWAHLDIAGVETREEDDPRGPKGPSGFGVRLLDALVAARFEAVERMP